MAQNATILRTTAPFIFPARFGRRLLINFTLLICGATPPLLAFIV